MSKETLQSNQINIVSAAVEDVEAIVGLIGQAPDALLSVTADEVLGWINNGQSVVAKNEEGKIVGHQGMAYWPNPNMVELRAAFVDPDFRGQGLNTRMKLKVMALAKESFPDAKIVGFTEAASKSRGILQKLGFKELPLSEVHDDLFGICPETCFRKTGKPCGCKVYILEP